MEALVFVGIAVLIGVAVWWAWYAKKKRREALANAAKQLGLQYAQDDPLGTLGLPFALLTKGDGRGVENVMWGSWQGLDVREFDYWYYEESRDSEGRTSRSYYRFSCAVTEIAAACSAITIGRESWFSRIADNLGFRDVEFELEEFNRAFQVKCQDRKFANDLIDQRMMQWLLQAGDDWNFEMAGPYVMAFSKRRGPAELVPLLGTLRAFKDQVPRVVYSLYGTQQAPAVQPPPVP
jgi:hypothetical protein